MKSVAKSRQEPLRFDKVCAGDNYSSSLEDTLKCVLISFDSTIRSNVAVDLPVDVSVYRNDSLTIDCRHRVVKDDAYFLAVRQHWGEGLRKVFSEIPNPDWC